MVSDEKLAASLIEELLYLLSNFSHSAFKIPCLLTVWLLCASGRISYFVLLWFHWASFMSNILNQIQEFFSYISSNIHSASFFISFLSFWGSQYNYVGILHHIPQISEVLLSFLHSFFLLFLRLDNFNISIIRYIYSSILICYWTPLAKILFYLLYFSTLVFPFGSFL